MDGERFDNVKYEKAKAMARFKRFQRIKKLWKVVVVVMLLSWTSKNIPAVVKFAGDSLFPVSGYVLNPHVAFLIGNAIIVVLLLLCQRNGAGNIPGGGDLHDEYARHSESQQPVGSDRESELTEEKEEMIAAENDSGGRGGGGGAEVEEEEKEMQIVVAENAQCEAVETAIAKATRQIRRFERTQSEKLRQEISVRPRGRELRRSETEMRRRSIIKPAEKIGTGTSSFDTVESLSSEEFKLAIDAFIDKHRELFHVQKMQELKELKSV